MEGKDWIILFIPIFCNGIVLFIFAQYIEIKKMKRQQAKLIRQELINKCLGMVEVILYGYCINEKEDLLHFINEKIPSFLVFSRENRARLRVYSSQIIDVEKIWDKLIEALRHVQDNEEGVIKGESGKIITSLVGKLFDVLVEIAQMCICDSYERGRV